MAARFSHVVIVAEQFTGPFAVVVHQDHVFVYGHHHPTVPEGRLHFGIRLDLQWEY